MKQFLKSWETPYIAVRYERGRESGEFGGNEYFFSVENRLAVGDIIAVPSRSGFSYVQVSRINVQQTDIPPSIRPFLGRIHGRPVKHIPEQFQRDSVQLSLF